MPSIRTFFAICVPSALALCSLACNSAPSPAPSLAEAFAGPAALSLHSDIDLKSSVVAHASHGDRLEILAQRRRWYKVRTASGLEGWTSDRELLDPGQMARLRALAAQTANLPSQGKATVFAPVNVHIEPSRAATSFVQVEPKDEFDVVAHRVTQRGPAPNRQLLPPRPKPDRKNAKSAKEKSAKEKKPSVPLPPAPAPPPPPPDWLAISKTDSQEPDPDAPAAPAPVNDDFTLIRTSDGHTGWILTSTIYMKIPDQVAQYAEGHRITSYFQLGETNDKGESKPIWLWTTSERLNAPYDFDGFRVFTWNLRKHRYETAFIQRRETGYFPVEVKDGRFSVCLDRKGARVRREYSLTGNSVRFAAETPCAIQPVADPAPAPEFSLSLKDAATKTAGWLDNLRSRWNKLLGRK